MRIIYLILLFLIPITLVAGPNGENKFLISGTVIDTDKKPVSYVNIAVYNQTDSKLVTGTVTNDNGIFSLSVDPGKYEIRITFISYKDKIIENVSITDKSLDLGRISIEETTSVLSEVVVEGEKAEMKLELDKRVFNVGSDPTNLTKNAADILDNIPSVSVDVEGNVSLRGSESVRILVDGRPSGLVGISSTAALRQMQGDMIERVEVVTNPSAKYEAEGSAGIINIVLKKDKKKGLNGSFTTNVGDPTQLGLSGNINYRTGKFNVFGNYGLGYRTRPGGGSSYQTYYLSDTTYTTFTDNERERSGLSNSFRIGSDFYLSDKDIITGSGLIRISDEENDTWIKYRDVSEDGILVRETDRHDNEVEDDRNNEYRLSYKRIFPGKDHELIIDMQYREGNETEESKIEESFSISDAPYLFQRSLNKEGDKSLVAQADYTHAFSNDKKLELGYRGAFREITSDHVVEEQNDQGEWESLPDFTNNFLYEENVQALYMTYQNKMKNWGYQLGLRTENTNVETFQEMTGESNDRQYLDFFPSVFLSYELNKENTLQASYTRRISRPRFWYLNPFFSYSNPRFIRTGNPDVNPEYTDSYEMGYLLNLEKVSFYGGGFYRYTTGRIQRVSYIDNIEGDTTAITFSKPFNVGKENAYGVETNFTFDPWPWYSINGNANFYKSVIEGSYNEEEISRNTYGMRFQLSNKVKFGKFDLQLRGWYRAPEKTTQGRRNGMVNVDFGGNWQVLKGKGTLTLNVRDLFNTMSFKGVTKGLDFYSESESHWHSRSVSLSFTYLLNRNSKARNGRDNRGGGQGGDDAGFDGEGMDF